MLRQIDTDNVLMQDMLSYIRRECREKEKESAQRYNFDFLQGRPQEAEGARFKWTLVPRQLKQRSTPSLKLRKFPRKSPLHFPVRATAVFAGAESVC